MAAEHYIYKYVFHDEIIYIGKVDSDLKRRVEEHAKEEKFLSYLKEAAVFCIQLANPTETTFMELYLINKYKPVLNVVAKYEATRKKRYKLCIYYTSGTKYTRKI